MYLLCYSDAGFESSIFLSKIENELALNNIHGKYNFYIQPVSNNDKINIKGSGCRLKLIMPKVLDFSNNDTISIDLILEQHNYCYGIAFNPNKYFDFLTCKDLNFFKRCSVPKNHFENNKSGYYNIYHLNHMNEYIKFYEYSPIQVILPREVIIGIKDSGGKNPEKLGQKGAISFSTDFEDLDNIFNSSDIETETLNKMEFSGNNKTYLADCHFWKPKDRKLILICKFNEKIDTPYIILNKKSFYYKECMITLFSQHSLTIIQLNSNISFLYADEQIINITENITEYNLEFKKEVYNKEPLILYNFYDILKNIHLNCVEEPKKIRCPISKDKLIQIINGKSERFYLSQLTESEGILRLLSVSDIIINYESVEKKIINLNITKLLTPTVVRYDFIVFETNITDIPIIITDIFIFYKNTIKELKCQFKKSSNQKDDKLLLLCQADSEGEHQLDIKETNLDNIHILYSFKIPATNFTEKINVTNGESASIILVYPNSLNFESQDKLTIYYHTHEPEELNHIKLNDNSTSELECINKHKIKKCTVPQSNFNNSGYYYTYHINSLGNKVIFYEIPKIQIILKKKEDESKTDDDGGSKTDGDSGSKTDGDGGNREGNSNSKNLVGIIVGSVVGGLALIAAIVVIIIFVKKRKSNFNEINCLQSGDNILPNSAQAELVEGDKFGKE